MPVRVSGILRSKGDTVATVTAVQTVAEVLKALADHGVGALVVSDDEEGIDGIVSERDIVRALARGGGAVLGQQVASIMTTDVLTCVPTTTVEELAKLMTERRIRHVPVLVDGRLSGIVSIGDVVKSRITELETETEAIKEYVWNGR